MPLHFPRGISVTLHLRPSGAHRWSNCAAYPSFSARVAPRPDSDPAREGTAAAWVAECVLKGTATTCSDLVGRTHANGWFITPDMAADVQQYVDLIQKRGGEISAEEQVTLYHDPGKLHIGGTLDASSLMVTENGLLHVDDLKYGYRVVEVRNNPQLIIYGAAKAANLIHQGHAIKLVQLAIYQPRAFHRDGIYRKWVISIDELWDAARLLINQGIDCAESEPVATPGPWCDECPAAASCVALAHTNYKNVTRLQSTQQRDMTALELSRELSFIDEAETLIHARAKAVQAEAEARIKTERIPGWRMVSTKGHRKFTVAGEMVQLLTGVDPWSKKLITPAEAERRGADKAVVSKISAQPEIGHKLVRFDEDDVAMAFAGANK